MVDAEFALPVDFFALVDAEFDLAVDFFAAFFAGFFVVFSVKLILLTGRPALRLSVE
ncbi:MAG: hypothetical protein ACE5M4_03545 [Anaerolineales bacterium]